MKTTYLSAFLLGTLLPVYAFAQNNTFTITGKINLSHDGEKVYINYIHAQKNQVDSSLVANGAFTLTGEIDVPCLTYIRVGNKHSSNATDFYLAAGHTNMVTTDSLKYATISGNKIAVDYFRLMEPIRSLQKEKLNYFLKHHRIPQEEKEGPEALKLQSKIKDVNKQIMALTYAFIENNPSSAMSLESLENLSGAIIDYSVVYPKFNRLSDKLKNSPKGKAFAEKIDLAKNMAVGAKALDFESTTTDGKKLQLKEVLTSGKYTLLDFWASWCGPCRKENPNIVKAYTSYHQKGLNVLSVSLDDDAEKWKTAIEKDGMRWHHVSDLKGWKEPVALLYGIRALPQNVLLDAKGIVLAKNLQAEELLKKLAGLMK